LAAIRNCGLMTVEGEKDDISGVGQTYAAQELCVNIPEAKKLHHLQTEVGHYGVFNGSRFREEIAPRIRDFIAMNEEKPAKRNGGAKPAAKCGKLEALERAPSFRRACKDMPSREEFSVKGEGLRAASRSTEFAMTLDGSRNASARRLAQSMRRSGPARPQAASSCVREEL
jgi:PHB de-polymerase C-terminus